jgi:hypothetical protein
MTGEANPNLVKKPIQIFFKKKSRGCNPKRFGISAKFHPPKKNWLVFKGNK